MLMTNSPCFNCTKRNAECHSICEEYAEFAKENEKKREARHAEAAYRRTVLYGMNRTKQLCGVRK